MIPLWGGGGGKYVTEISEIWGFKDAFGCISGEIVLYIKFARLQFSQEGEGRGHVLPHPLYLPLHYQRSLHLYMILQYMYMLELR